MTSLARRAVYVPVQLGFPHLTRRIYALADALERGDEVAARGALDWLEEATAEAPARALDEHLKAQTLASILRDLYENGWEVSREGNELHVLAPRWGAARSTDEAQREKARARRSVEARRSAQFASPSVAAFIRSMERPARGQSVRALIADGEALAAALAAHGEGAVKPYLQLARPADGIDEHTGLRLQDCFRYFRYYWAFPAENTPGRRLPMLIRDAGQPNHPVCGLLCLASPLPQLGSRDASFGWTPAWLEAVIAALDISPDALELGVNEALRAPWGALEEALRRSEDTLTPRRIAWDLAALLDLPRVETFGALIKRLRAEAHHASPRARFEAATRRLAHALVSPIEDALNQLSFDELGCAAQDVFASPDAIDTLDAVSARAEAAWDVARGDRKRADRTAVMFWRKRARKALLMAEAWWELAPLREALAGDDHGALIATLRVSCSPRQHWWDASSALAPDHGLSLGLQRGLREHKVNMIASRIADISVCGAIEPYRALLGGKLAAMLALSSDMAVAYREAYGEQVSDIQSKMAGEDIIRDADLVGLVTTSFYSVGSAQYNRVSLPEALGGARWERIGISEGQGTMHFSRETTSLIQRLLARDGSKVTVMGTFGEGPSERLRKLREGLSLLGLPTSELLTHGMSRIVYAARLDDTCLPGTPPHAAPYADAGPTGAQVAAAWRERWLASRITRPGVLDEVRAFSRDAHLLSAREADALATLPAVDEADEVVEREAPTSSPRPDRQLSLL